MLGANKQPRADINSNKEQVKQKTRLGMVISYGSILNRRTRTDTRLPSVENIWDARKTLLCMGVHGRSLSHEPSLLGH